MDTGDREKFNRLLSQARSDFDRIRSQNKPIRVQLLHKATNAEAEGVRGIPRAFAGAIAFHGAGNREARQVFDERGNATFRKDPIIESTAIPSLTPLAKHSTSSCLLLERSRLKEITRHTKRLQELPSGLEE